MEPRELCSGREVAVMFVLPSVQAPGEGAATAGEPVLESALKSHLTPGGRGQGHSRQGALGGGLPPLPPDPDPGLPWRLPVQILAWTHPALLPGTEETQLMLFK